jgi:hypothetical protein
MTPFQQSRRERAITRLARLRAAAADRFQREHQILDQIPLGQPILLSHHSERRHRRDIEKSNRLARAGLQLQREADRAEAAVQHSGYAITSDDPDALPALTARLEALKIQHAHRKRINQAYRKGGWDAVATIANPEELAHLRHMMALCTWMRQPCNLTNLSANIRRVQERVRQLEANAQMVTTPPRQYRDFTVEESAADLRIRIRFDTKPPAEIRTILKGHGFRWSPTEGAWQRLLNGAGRYAVSRAADEIKAAQHLLDDAAASHDGR